MDNKTPIGWETKKMTDILTDAQLDETQKILDEKGLDDFERSNKLKRYYESFKAQLDAKGVDPGFLAYVVVFRQWTGSTNGKH